MSEKYRSFHFTNREIAMLAAFSVLLLSVDLIWILGPILGNIIYGIIDGIILITAAIVIGRRYTVLNLGIIRTIVEIFIAGAFVGTLTAFDYLVSALVLETILQFSTPYAANLRINVLGMTLYGLVTRLMFITISVFIYGMILPLWLMLFMIIVPVITYAIGGFIGHGVGNRVKNTVTAI
ncbi:hypothetical protein [Methanothermobacter sp.]|uniref:hypothetical protein n=1 Tax=Methanothermobacter sp. TaxID=1884223 RepID=UPI002623D999|nr:hypothetical protein [Methanothermobacter sp.]MDI9614587.1 hypothetical protein [Methanothermobacter sp.]